MRLILCAYDIFVELCTHAMFCLGMLHSGKLKGYRERISYYTNEYDKNDYYEDCNSR